MAQGDVNAINDGDIFDKDSVSTDFQSAIARALNDLSATSENLQVVVSEIMWIFLLFKLLYLRNMFFRENTL